MRFLPNLLIASASILPSCLGALVPARVLADRSPQTAGRVPDQDCENGPNTRPCWSDGFSIATDFDQKFPTGGQTVTYNLDLVNTTCNPDGHGERICLLFNNQFPGPVLRATWGDTMVINVKNSLQDNGTSVHWHGVRQYNSVTSDGVNGVTQCALAPGDTQTYTFPVTQYGSSWAHTHLSVQYGDGGTLGLIFDGPASGNYDEDLGIYPVTDWYYDTIFNVGSQATANFQKQQGPPPGDTILINGTNKNANGGGQYSQVNIEHGKRYRLRLVNTGADAFIRVSLDNHVMEVIATDFIPVQRTSVNSLVIGIGQRYDVVITANQTAGNYWFRANAATECASNVNHNALAIWSYDNVTVADPTSQAWPSDNVCLEPKVEPYWDQPIPQGNFIENLHTFGVNTTRAEVIPGEGNIVVWALNTSSINIDWDMPTIEYIREGNTSYPQRLAVYPTESEGTWNYWLLQELATSAPIPHPIHLHGHDFFVLGQGNGNFLTSGGESQLNFNTPPRRDTAILPGGGWMVLAFDSNNPGTWLMHCHIVFHISSGLGMQFVESPENIDFGNTTEFDRICNNFKNYEKTAYYRKDDSGL